MCYFFNQDILLGVHVYSAHYCIALLLISFCIEVSLFAYYNNENA